MSLWQLLPLLLCTNIARSSDLTQYSIPSIPADDVMSRNPPVFRSVYLLFLPVLGDSYRVRNTSQGRQRTFCQDCCPMNSINNMTSHGTAYHDFGLSDADESCCHLRHDNIRPCSILQCLAGLGGTSVIECKFCSNHGQWT